MCPKYSYVCFILPLSLPPWPKRLLVFLSSPLAAALSFLESLGTGTETMRVLSPPGKQWRVPGSSWRCASEQ